VVRHPKAVFLHQIGDGSGEIGQPGLG
jgi:hypothetical protein